MVLVFSSAFIWLLFPGMHYLPGSCSLEMKDKIFESYLKNVMLNSWLENHFIQI